MAREYYFGLIEEFVDSSVEAVLGKLADNNQFNLELTQRNAWKEEIAGTVPGLESCIMKVRQ